METRHQIIHGDSRRMARVADDSVQLVVTSPPYWQLKDYGTPDQIGFHESYEDYINALNHVWSECSRVLVPSGRLCVNIGDQFARAAYYGRYKVIPIRTEIIRFAETIGLDHMGAIIWRKVTTCNTSGGATIMGSFPHPPNGVLKLDYEFILLFKKPGKRSTPPDAAAKRASRLTTEEWNEWFQGHWSFPGVRQQRHLAAFPEELPRRLIRMFSFVGDTVLDPFAGSGTTSHVARELDRHSVGYELNAEFIEVIRGRLAPGDVFQGGELEFGADPLPVVVDDEALPYRFVDPVGIDRPRKLKRYGSKIDGSERRRRETFKVAEILDHDRIRLGDGRCVRLIGVGAARVSDQAARDGLAALCLGKRVTLEPDPALDSGDERYVHLPNRKFVNAHVIKRGLAAVDVVRNYRHRKRFERYAAEAAADSEHGIA